ncbi:MFS transporter [Microbacterium sp. RD1]|uniref:MFS transporter n=1 Tax=Microbacterium sp. RD1 TaxID=3457313 RepID=UPI003FA5BCB9
MSASSSSAPRGATPRSPHLALDRRQVRRAITAAALGNTVEWYDAAVYLYIAGVLGHVFFAGQPEPVQLISSFALFAVAYLVRPLGGIILGPLADRVGRQRVLSLTILMMGAATLAIGLIPSPETIGAWAVILLLLCRLVQGFSTGGEYGGATTFIAEYAPDNRRGFYGAWLEVGTLGGFTLGAGVVTSLLLFLGPEATEEWGWRIPFLIAGPLSLIGFYLRKRLEETPAFVEAEKREETLSGTTAAIQIQQTVGKQWRQLLKCAGLVIVFNVGYYLVLTYLPVYLNVEVGLDESTGLLLTLVIMVGMLLANPWVGLLSDHIGRKPILTAGCVAFITLSVPAFLMMQAGGILTVLGVVLLSLIFTCFTGVIPSTLPALFPTTVRNGALGISYNLSVSLFGGTTPLIVTALIAATGNNLMPAYWMMFAAVVGIVALWRITESAGRPLPGSPAMRTTDETAGDPAPDTAPAASQR